jgi:hypothetical protein
VYRPIDRKIESSPQFAIALFAKRRILSGMRPFFIASILLLQPMIGIKVPHKNEPPNLPTRQFLDDMRGKNLQDILTMYLPDAVFIDPSGHKFSSPDARRQLYQNTFATYDSELVFSETHLKYKGDMSKPGLPRSCSRSAAPALSPG